MASPRWIWQYVRVNVSKTVRAALREDRAWSDVTSRLFLPKGLRGEAVVVAKDKGAVAGARAAAVAFRVRDRRCRVSIVRNDGRAVRRGDIVLKVRGPLASILSAERVALNFLTHLSGIATLTREFVRRAGGRAKILHTRKTLPGLRDLENAAVLAGGGTAHRRDLSAAVLVKENHLDAWKGRLAPADFAYRILAARRAGLTTIIEARNKGEILGALEAGADVLLLDNFSTARLRPIVRWIGSVCRKRGLRRPLLEVSGGVNLRTVGRITRAGVDRISVGGITHSAPALDMSLDIRG